MTNPSVELDVSVYGTHVGVVRVGPQRQLWFYPDSGWIRAGQHPRLGWSFLIDPSARKGGSRLPAWFESLLPEQGSPLRSRLCEHYNLPASSGPALLTVLGRDLPGAVVVKGETKSWEDEVTDADNMFVGRLRFSAAGMQPKLSLIRSGDRWTLPAKDQTGAWLVKFAGRNAEYEELPLIEHCTTQWAGLVGLEVPEHMLIDIDALDDVDVSFSGRFAHAFAIRRFDRPGPAPHTNRIHQEDFAQALEITDFDKYGGAGRKNVSYDSLARFVADACGAGARDAFIDRVAFMVASGNDDAHLKNWSLQWQQGEQRPRLSPCYDLVASLVWATPQRPPELSLPFASSKDLESLDIHRVRRFAQQSATPDAESLFLAALERAQRTWPAIREAAPASMRTMLEELWERVPVLRSLGGLKAH